MKTVSLLFLLFVSLVTQVAYSQTDYIESYHKVICKGDLMVLQENYDSALFYYQAAFANVTMYSVLII